MEMTSERLVPASRQAVWEALNAPQTLQGCIAGCEKLEQAGGVDEGEFDVAMAIKIGPVAAKFKGKMWLKDIVAPDSYSIVFEGQGGMAGFAKGTASVRLVNPEQGEGTLLQYEVHAQVGGKLAQLGARLIDSSAKKMADDFFARFVKVFAPEPETPQDIALAEPPAKTSGAVRSMWSRMTR